MKAVKWIAWILVIIGGINWGLVGLFNVDLVAYLPAVLAKVVYILVGLSAVVMIVVASKGCASEKEEAPAVESAPEAPAMEQPSSPDQPEM
jgi:uncharacterized membrane protein YuzA (DUF378 family)